MNTFFNTEITPYPNILMELGDIALAPVQYLCNGRKYFIVNSTEVNHEGLRFPNPRWYLVALAVVAFIPSVVIGGLIKGASLCFAESRRNFKLVQDFVANADPFWHLAKTKMTPIAFKVGFKSDPIKDAEKKDAERKPGEKPQEYVQRMAKLQGENYVKGLLAAEQSVSSTDIEEYKKQAGLLTTQLELCLKSSKNTSTKDYNIELNKYITQMSNLVFMIARDLWTTCEGDKDKFSQKLIEDKSLSKIISVIKFTYEFTEGQWYYQNDKIVEPPVKNPYQGLNFIHVQNTVSHLYYELIALNPAFADKFPKVEIPIGEI